MACRSLPLKQNNVNNSHDLLSNSTLKDLRSSEGDEVAPIHLGWGTADHYDLSVGIVPELRSPATRYRVAAPQAITQLSTMISRKL